MWEQHILKKILEQWCEMEYIKKWSLPIFVLFSYGAVCVPMDSNAVDIPVVVDGYKTNGSQPSNKLLPIPSK